MFGKPCRNRVRRLNVPDALLFPDFAPFEIAGRTKHLHEDFGLVPGVKNNEPHAFLNTFLNAVDDLVLDFAMRHVPPPEKNIGLIQKFLAEPVFFILVKPRIADVESSVFEKRLADRDMDSLRICLFAGFMLKFMAVLVPYGDIDLPVHHCLFVFVGYLCFVTIVFFLYF